MVYEVIPNQVDAGQEGGGFKCMSFAQKVQFALQNDHPDQNQLRQEAYEYKPKELIVQIIEQEVLFDGEVC